MNNELIKEKVPLTGMTKLELEQMCTDHYEPEFRGRQLFHWIYAKRKREIREMANVPKKLRDELTQKFKIPTGEKIESVLMEDGERITVCLSTQVGCALGCTFCATAKMGFQKSAPADDQMGRLAFDWPGNRWGMGVLFCRCTNPAA